MNKMLWVFVFSLLLHACGVSKQSRENQKIINGAWTLNDVSFSGNTGDFKAVLFNDVEDICLEDSSWFFRNNNSTGTYTIKPSSLCKDGLRYIRWSVITQESSNVSQLQFKFTDASGKDISGNTGYRLNILALSDTDMKLSSDVIVDGKKTSVLYNFSKN